MTKRKLIRPEDALDFLQWANDAPRGSKEKQAYLEGAAFELWAGKRNQAMGAKDNRREHNKGAPRGARIDDTAVFRFMDEEAKLMLKPIARELANRAYSMKDEKGFDTHATEASTISRWERGWSRWCKNK